MVLYQAKDGYSYNSDSIFLYSFIREFPLKGKLLDSWVWGCIYYPMK